MCVVVTRSVSVWKVMCSGGDDEERRKVSNVGHTRREDR